MSTSVTVPDGTGKTARPPRTRPLSPACRSLLELIRWVNFGRIEELAVRGGDPVFDPPPRVVRAVRLAQPGPSRHQSTRTPSTLRREEIGLVQELATIGTGVIHVIKIHDGLPVALEIHQQV